MNYEYFKYFNGFFRNIFSFKFRLLRKNKLFLAIREDYKCLYFGYSPNTLKHCKHFKYLRFWIFLMYGMVQWVVGVILERRRWAVTRDKPVNLFFNNASDSCWLCCSIRHVSGARRVVENEELDFDLLRIWVFIWESVKCSVLY